MKSSKKRVRAWAIVEKKYGVMFLVYLERDFATYEMERYPLFYGDYKLIPCEIIYTLPPKACLRRQARGKK